jgi:WD40 repeat protein/predicted Ser/Thr protein kinase
MTTPNIVDDPLDAVLAVYFQQLDRGERIAPQALIETHPELADSLREFFDAANFLERLAGPTQAEHTQQLSLHDTSRAARLGETIVAAGRAVDSHDQRSQSAQSPPPTPAEGNEELRPLVAAIQEGVHEHFGRYRLQRLLGQGAMGSVYLAYDPQLERRVALKIPKFTAEENPEMSQRFFREARSAATLRHANICPVHDVGQIGGTHYITMAYIEGRTLAEELRGGRQFQVKEIATIIRKLAQALSKAHAAGIVHRDIKPGNIMLDADDEPVLMDFGLAYRAETDELRLTRAGTVIGSPAYMSPEQLDGDPARIGPHSDIYSLGVVLFEMLTGKLPFTGSMMSVIGQIAAKEPPPIGSLRAELANSPVEKLCQRMMAKKPEDRPASMQEVAGEIAAMEAAGAVGNALRGAAPAGALRGVPPQRKELPPGLVMAHRPASRDNTGAVVVVLLVLALAAMCLLPALGAMLYWTMARSQPDHATIDEAAVEVGDDSAMLEPIVAGQQRDPHSAITEVVSFEGHTGPIKSVAFSPDGKLALSGSGWPHGDGTARLWEVTTGREVRTLGTPGAWVMAVAFSPDGKRAATGTSDQIVCLWDVASGGKLSQFTLEGGAEVLQFEPGGRYLLAAANTEASPRRGEVRLWDTESDSLVWHYSVDEVVFSACFFPDGQRVAVAKALSQSIEICDARTGDVQRSIDRLGIETEDLAISPNGQQIACVGHNGEAALFDIETGNEIKRWKASDLRLLALEFSSDGSHVLVGGHDAALQIFDAASGQRVARVENPGGSVWDLAISSDGQHVLTAGGTRWKNDELQQSGDFSLRMWRLPELAASPAETTVSEVTTAERLFTGPNSHGQAVDISTDGSQVLVGHYDGGVSLWDVASGKEARRFPGADKAISTVLFWPDGKHVAAASEDASIRLWNIETGEGVRQFNGHTGRVDCLALSRDGSLLMSGSADYEEDRDQSVRLWNAATGKELRRFGDVAKYIRELAFGHDASRAYGVGAGLNSVIEWDVSTGAPVHRFPECATPPVSLAVSPHGRLLATGHMARRRPEGQWNDAENSVVRLWDINARSIMHELRGHTGPVGDVAFTPDGRYLLSAATDEWDGNSQFFPSSDRSVRVWEVSTSRELARYKMHERVIQLVVTPDSRSFITVGHSMRLWTLPESLWPAETMELPRSEPEEAQE